MPAYRDRAIAITVLLVAVLACDDKAPTSPTPMAATPVATAASNPAPTLTAVAPSNAVAGSTVVVTLTGSQFDSDTAIAPISGISIVEATIVDSTSITARLAIDAAAELGPRSVTVTTGAGTSDAQTFTVNAPAPSVGTMTPSTLTVGTTTTVTITGTSFVPGSTTITASGDGVTIANISGPLAAATGRSFTAFFIVDASASPGLRRLTITTPGGTSTRTFTIAARLPGIERFTADPVIITRGRSATLSWRGVTNATSCNINVDIGTVPCADGSVVVTPTSTTEYMFSAVGAGGREWLYATVNVEAPVPLPVVTVTAVNDSYTMNEDATLTVPALSGVLTGDAASSGATLTAALGTGPAHGIVTLNPNGSFAYTPNADYSGSDSFTYRATDGQATSTPATVTITVTQLFDDSRTFQAVNRRQEFIVPPAVTSLQIEANGAQGGSSATTVNGGLGGSVRATVAVTPGETLFIFVGGHGRDRVPLDSGAGGFNGGGLGENGEFSLGGLGGGGGGGASDVRQGGMALANRIVIAGGGGGGGGNNVDGPGGNGGGLIGGAGQSVLVHPGSGGLVGAGGGGGAGGSQSSGGAGGTPQLCPAGADGALGTGGDGADCLNSGGGGGGGYYGGGGGGSAINFAAGAGGGGSSFTDPAAHSVTHVQGCCTGDGQIVLRW